MNVNLEVIAMPTKDIDDLTKDSKYEVEEIHMGQSHTAILINGRIYNSIHFDFYIDDKKINIYDSRIFNHYVKSIPQIRFEEE